MTKRPDHVRCAQMDLWDGDPPKPTNKTWCGRIISPSVEWQFKDASHALLQGFLSGRLLLCAECAVAIKAALRAVSYRSRQKKT